MFEQTGTAVQEGGGESATKEGQQTTQGQPTTGDWREAIPAELRDAPQLKDIKDIGGLAKSFIDTQRFLGNSIRIPGEDAGENGRREFLEKLQKHAPELIIKPKGGDDAEFWELAGVPKDHAAYEVEEGTPFPEERITRIKEIAKKYGLTKTAFRNFVKDQVAFEASQAEESSRAIADDAKALQAEWGMAAEARIADVKKFAEVMKLPGDFRDALNNGRVKSDWIKALHGIIQQFGGIGEGKQVAFQPGGSIPDGPAEIKAKIAEIEANPDLLNSRSPQQKILVEKRLSLYNELEKAKRTN